MSPTYIHCICIYEAVRILISTILLIFAFRKTPLRNDDPEGSMYAYSSNKLVSSYGVSDTF